MNLSDFDFELPEELIATRPVNPRSAARLLVAKGDNFDDSFVSFTKNTRACRSHADTRVSAWKMQLHAETYLHAETLHGSTLKLSHFVSLLNEEFHAEAEMGLKPHADISLANSTLILEFQHGADFPR